VEEFFQVTSGKHPGPGRGNTLTNLATGNQAFRKHILE
jgi:hypothetical protein